LPTLKDESVALMPIDAQARILGAFGFDDRAIPDRPGLDINEEIRRRCDWCRRVAREKGHSKSIAAFRAHVIAPLKRYATTHSTVPESVEIASLRREASGGYLARRET